MEYLPSGLTMWSRACALIDEAERRHRRFFELVTARSQQPAWEPPVDIFVLDRELQVVVALPGVRVEDVEIDLTSEGLRWSKAASHLPRLAHQARILRLEIPYGRMEQHASRCRPGRYQLLGQELLDGCLRIRLSGEWS